MADFASISRAELVDRRRKLRQQRRLRALQAVWRLLAVSGLAAGLIWVAVSPIWVIRRPEQIGVEGNKLLSTETVQSLLSIAYPQSLFTLHPQTLAHQIEARAPIADAVVTRHLFPPALTVRIQERHPVAIAYTSQSQGATSVGSQVGLLDEEGTWMPIESYTSLEQSLTLPDLKVIGMGEQHRSHWKSLYQAVARSSLTISQIDWQDPANLILTTELGMVHCGPYTSRFAEQLRALDQMRELPPDVSVSQISYIDLRNPASPLIQMTQPIGVREE